MLRYLQQPRDHTALERSPISQVRKLEEPIPKMNLDLDDAFEELMRNAYPDIKEHSIQYRESRRIFFGGAATIFFHAMELTRLSDDEAEDGLSMIQKQLEEFYHLRLAQDKD